MDKIPTHLLERFDELYTRLTKEMNDELIPSREKMLRAVSEVSFKVFESPEHYLSNERAMQYVQFISTEHGDRAYRVYFNHFSKKVYVDLNTSFTGISRPKSLVREIIRSEISVEILKSLIFTDPRIHLGEPTAEITMPPIESDTAEEPT